MANVVDYNRTKIQALWDSMLIEEFFNKHLHQSMKPMVHDFLRRSKLGTIETLTEHNLTPERFPVLTHAEQMRSSPHRFICGYLPQLASLLWGQDEVSIESRISGLVRQIPKMKIFLTQEDSQSIDQDKLLARRNMHNKFKSLAPASLGWGANVNKVSLKLK